MSSSECPHGLASKVWCSICTEARKPKNRHTDTITGKTKSFDPDKLDDLATLPSAVNQASGIGIVSLDVSEEIEDVDNVVFGAGAFNSTIPGRRRTVLNMLLTSLGDDYDAMKTIVDTLDNYMVSGVRVTKKAIETQVDDRMLIRLTGEVGDKHLFANVLKSFWPNDPRTVDIVKWATP